MILGPKSAVAGLSPQPCRITHGPNESYFENLVGKPVASIRRCLVSVFSTPDEAEPWIGGGVVGAEFRPRAGDSVEFIVPHTATL